MVPVKFKGIALDIALSPDQASLRPYKCLPCSLPVRELLGVEMDWIAKSLDEIVGL